MLVEIEKCGWNDTLTICLIKPRRQQSAKSILEDVLNKRLCREADEHLNGDPDDLATCIEKVSLSSPKIAENWQNLGYFVKTVCVST